VRLTIYLASGIRQDVDAVLTLNLDVGPFEYLKGAQVDIGEFIVRQGRQVKATVS